MTTYSEGRGRQGSVCGTHLWKVQERGGRESPYHPGLRCRSVQQKDETLFTFSKQKKEYRPHSFSDTYPLFRFVPPIQECHSEQKIEVISVTVQHVTVTELTEGFLILV